MTNLSGEATLSTAPVSRLIQLSDTHLMKDPGGKLVGIDTDQSFAAVCRLIGQQPAIDALLLTGDLAGDEAESAYTRLRERLATLGVPSFGCLAITIQLRGKIVFLMDTLSDTSAFPTGIF